MIAYDPLYPANDSSVDKTPEYLRTKCEQLRTGQIVDAGLLNGKRADEFALKGSVVGGNTESSIIALGDSITAGAGSDPGATDPGPPDELDTHSWTNVVRTELGRVIHNKGIGGQTSTQILARFNTDVLVNKPTHCIIMWGVNDAYKPEQGVTFAQTQANTIEAISRCKVNNIVPIFGICAVTTGKETTPAAVNSGKIGSWIKWYCLQNGIDIIDFDSYMRSNVTGVAPPENIDSDGMHPSALGYINMGKAACLILRNILPEFIGTKSPLEDMISISKNGQAPMINYETGHLGIIKDPAMDNPVFWTCLQGGSPGTWGTTGFVRDGRASAPCRTWFLQSTDTGDYFFQKGDIVFSVSSTITVYRVDASGYANVHPIVAERATFTLMTTLQVAGASSTSPQAYSDNYSSPNITRMYNAGDTVYYTAQGSVYYMTSNGYHASSPYSPKASFVQLR